MRATGFRYTIRIHERKAHKVCLCRGGGAIWLTFFVRAAHDFVRHTPALSPPLHLGLKNVRVQVETPLLLGIVPYGLNKSK